MILIHETSEIGPVQSLYTIACTLLTTYTFQMTYSTPFPILHIMCVHCLIHQCYSRASCYAGMMQDIIIVSAVVITVLVFCGVIVLIIVVRWRNKHAAATQQCK